ncbi:bacteriocin [Streptococcus ruminantium]|uniref:Bacteriocin n=1 Tax=Streptococcus ruminantium TaxID=1917441 RepID=A0ABU1B6K0_9STRE|nr:bacteriocin [Streptococcus ruminantium]MDQ8758854.1 bacteriocin [Streptococcus ruminantium]MDQ8764803.1 bacteriocin [Streptococcus ruminantium]MDQ8768229.1 bacteriocin [Streptococcus ruminantium]MDQ8774692.1 bacteriocin [Streptococcus ruminantium]MDQ8793596.1 bacteriocin [Streptococcus ruminantium]
MNTKTTERFEVIEAEKLAKIAPGAYCKTVNGKTSCSVDYKELWGYTGQVIVNGWINYGPWHARPGIGVIIP